MSDNSPQQKKDSILKSLAVLGLLGAITVIAWSSVQLVRVLPEAFSSLASLAKSVSPASLSQGDTLETIVITKGTTLANVGEPVTISWGAGSTNGNFVFSYQCTEGIAIDLQGIAGLKSITCDTPYTIGSSTTLTFTVDSEKKRYADLWYTLGFVGTNDTAVRASTTGQLTVVNSTIVGGLATTTRTEEEPPIATTVPTTTPEVIPAIPAVPTKPVVETPQVTTPVSPVKKPEIIYAIPVSDPQGRIDLGAKFVSIGTIVQNKFIQKAVRQDQAGAIQFEIKNYGTKTSGAWTYSVTLPDKTTYTSKTQLPLKPNERAVLTIGFPATTIRSHTFVVKVEEASDTVSLNNSFKQIITFVK